MRTLAVLVLLLAGSVSQAQVSTGGGRRGSQGEMQTVVQIQLKHAKASVAEKMLKDLGVEANIAADSRLNTLVVSATEDTLKKIKDFIATIDADVPDNETTTIYPTDVFQNVDGGGEIVKQIADSSGVKIAFDKDLGLVMVKGQKDEVSRTLQVIEQIKLQTDLRKAEKLQEKKHAERLADEKRQTEPFALRVFWLSNAPSEEGSSSIEPDAGLKKSIEKLAELGFPNMKVEMQLLGRCEVVEGKAKCSLEGSTFVGNLHRTLNSQANLSLTSDSQMNGEFKLEADVDWLSSGAEVDRTSVEVGINLQLKKYYILSATPVGGFQTAFVVQLIDGL